MPALTQQIRFCTSCDGTRIAYAVCGSGPPLLWAPHWVHHLDHDWDSLVWRPWLDLLTRAHTVVCYDGRGCGLSDRNLVEFSDEFLADDFQAVVDAAGFPKVSVVGVGNGALAAAAFAARRPDQVSQLAIVGCNTRGRLAANPTSERVAEVRARLELFRLGWTADNSAYAQLFNALHFPGASREQALHLDELRRKTTTAETAVKLIEVFARVDLSETLPRIACPALVFASRGDLIVPFEDGRRAASLIPGARFVPLESANHILMADEPAWTTMARALADFLPGRAVAPASKAMLELTAREREVLELVALGLNNEAIADRLRISEKTVRNHASIIFDKLQVSSRAEAVARARDAGMGRPQH